MYSKYFSHLCPAEPREVNEAIKRGRSSQRMVLIRSKISRVNGKFLVLAFPRDLGKDGPDRFK